MSKIKNRGMWWRRTKYKSPFDPNEINREKMFAELWEEENKPVEYLNYGFGILQNLMCSRSEFGETVVKKVISGRDRMIAATVVQWLATNVGWCFIERCINKCGYEIVRKRS